MNRTPRQTNRRGAALFLVLIALAVSVVLATAFLDSRNTSIPIADGLDTASHVRRAANSGLELALASIAAELDFDWESIQNDGILARDITVDHVNIHIDAKDIDTGEPPTNDTNSVLLRATGTLNGVEIASETILQITPPDAPLNLDFSEIALLAEDHIRLTGDAVLLPWLANPLRTGPANELLLGTLNGDPDRVQFEQDAIAADAVRLEVDPSGSAALGGRRVLLDALPPLSLPAPPTPHSSPIGDVVLGPDHTGDIDAANIRIRSGAPLHIQGDTTIRSRGTIVIEPGAEILVEEGTLVLDAAKAFEITGAHLTKSPNAHLAIIARHSLTIRDSVIAPSNIDPHPLGETPPNDEVAELTIRDAGDEIGTISITGTSRLMTTILAPKADVSITGHTVLYGRVLARRIHAGDHAAIFARPDDGSSIGLSTPFGPHRDDDGRLRDDVITPDRTHPQTIANLVESLDVAVSSMGNVIEPNWDNSTARPRAARRSAREARQHERRGRHRRHWTRRDWRS